MNEITNIEGIVVRSSSFKENDAMVTIIANSGLVSFLSRGVLKPGSKNFSSCGLLALSRFSLAKGRAGGLSLSEGECLRMPDSKGSFAISAVFNLIAELSSKLIQADEAAEAFPWLKTSLEAIDGGFEPLSACLLYFAHLLEIAGYGLDVDECVLCHSKTDIIALSYEEGGFICRNCLGESSGAASARKLKILRYAFRSNLTDFSRVSFDKGETIPLIRELSHYLNDLTGIELKSLKLLEKA
jgi:DNA repair protein RecO (recombination protein O)